MTIKQSLFCDLPEAETIMYAVAEVDKVVTGRVTPSTITEQWNWGKE